MQEPNGAEPQDRRLGLAEFSAMTAALMAMNALAIDIMLPALSDIGSEFSLASENDPQLVIVLYMLGFGVSQLFWGPLSDRLGRRPILWFTLVGYSLASLACVFAPSFAVLLFARIVQGVMAGASRVIAVAAARDLYSGRRMAQVMSLVMMIFMAAPIIAPSIGQLVLLVADWRSIFFVLALFGLAMLAWCALRMPETLRPDARRPFRLDAIASAYATVLRTRESCGYIFASTCLFGCLMSFIASSEQMFRDVYAKGLDFALWFAGVALAMSAANLLNSRLVMRLGMRRVSHTALLAFIVISAAHAALAAVGAADFPVFYALLLLAFFCIGLQGPNNNAIMMEPLGRLAGAGAALSGCMTSFGSGLVGGAIARAFDGSTLPIFVGHALLGCLALMIILFTERGRLFASHDRSETGH